MRNFFLVLLNRSFLSSDNTKDRIFQCNSDIYSDIQSNKKELSSDPSYLHSYIEKSCSLTTYSNITSATLRHTSIFPSNINNIIDVILHYNNTYSEYQRIDLNNTEDSLCPVNDSWTDWISGRLQKIYRMVCNSKVSQGYCIASYNALVSNDIIFLFNSLDAICPLTTTTHYTTIGSNRGVTSMNTTVVPQSDRFAYYKQRVDGLANKTAVINTQLSLLYNNTLSLRNENSNLRFELRKVTDERDSLKNQVLNLEADIVLCERRIEVLTTNLTTAQNHEKALQVKLDNTTYQFQRANHSLHVVSLAVSKLRNSSSAVSHDDTEFFEAQQANYTNHLNSYVQDKKSTDKSLRDTRQNIKTAEQEIERLQRELEHKNHELQNKNIELDNTYALLNITLSNIDQIYNNVTVLNHSMQGIAKHGVSKRNINNQYNETQDDHAVSKQIRGTSYEARVADSERKVEEILTIFASIEKENNILKARIHQNEGKGIEDLQSYNLTESNLKTSDITTTGQEVKNSEIINKVEEYNSGVQGGVINNIKGDYNNKSLYVLPDVPNSFSISEENVNYNKNQGGLMTSYETTDQYDTMVKQVEEDIAHIQTQLQGRKFNDHNKPSTVLPDDYTGNVNSTNKSIGNTEVNPYPIYSITIGGIALSGVALYLTNKYCFAITKWPIMAYKYITSICQMSGTEINDNGMALSKVVEKEEAATLNSLNEPLYLPQTEERDSFDSDFSQDLNHEYDRPNRFPIDQPLTLKEKEGYLVPTKFVTFAQNTPTTTSNSEGNNTYQNISKEEPHYDVPGPITPTFNVRANISNNSTPELYIDMQGASSAITVEM